MIPQRNISLISNALVTAGGRRIPEAVIERDYPFYLRYQGPLPDRPIHRIFDGFDDLPEGPTLKVYAIKEIVVEKLLALSDRARNEPRDLYDLWHLFDSADLRIAELRAELDAKLALRKRVIAGMEQAIAAKEDRLRRLWVNRLAHQTSQLPPFDEVFREVMRVVRAAGLPGPQAK